MNWIQENFWRFFCPLVTEMVKRRQNGGYLGILRIYIFGIRVASFQLTKPW